MVLQTKGAREISTVPSQGYTWLLKKRLTAFSAFLTIGEEKKNPSGWVETFVVPPVTAVPLSSLQSKGNHCAATHCEMITEVWWEPTRAVRAHMKLACGFPYFCVARSRKCTCCCGFPGRARTRPFLVVSTCVRFQTESQGDPRTCFYLHSIPHSDI